MNAFGKRISERRKALGLTQKELAEKLNVSDKTISKWETGRSYPDVPLLTPLSKVLEIDLNQLLDVPPQTHPENNSTEAIDHGLISQYKGQCYLSIGLVTIGFIAALIGLLSGENVLMGLLFTLGAASIIFGFVYFLYASGSFHSIYHLKSDTSVYDKTYANQSSLVIFFLSIPFLIPMFIVHGFYGVVTMGAIVLILSMVIQALLLFFLRRAHRRANFRVKDNALNKVLIGGAAVAFFLAFSPFRIPFLFPFPFVLLFITLLNHTYVEK